MNRVDPLGGRVGAVGEGDRAWRGVDMRREPGLVEAGMASLAENMRCEDGRWRSRGGNVACNWAGVTSGEPTPLGTVYGAVRWKDPFGSEGLVVALGSGAKLCRPGTAAVSLAYPAGVTVGGRVRLVQAFNRLFMLRGAGLDPLVWDGDGTHAWEVMATAAVGSGFLNVPKAGVGAYFQNRLLLVDGQHEVLCSDILDEQAFNVANRFYVEQGGDDQVVGLSGHGGQAVVVWGRRSIWALAGFYADLGAVSLDLVSANAGCVAPDSVAMAGTDLWFLSDRGVFSLALAWETRMEAVAVPLSEAMQPVIERINWAYAHRACGVVHNNRYYLAVPTDSATSNTTVLVYNFETRAWEGYDTLHGNFAVGWWCPVSEGGRMRLMGVTPVGYVVYYDLLEECFDRLTSFLWYAVTSKVRTRGYGLGSVARKAPWRARVAVGTWRPRYTVRVLAEGPGEAREVISARTKDRTRWTVWGHEAFSGDNSAGDHDDPYREDYSVVVSSSGYYPGTAGVQVDLMQEWEEVFGVWPQTGRAPQVEVENNQGRIEVRGVEMLLRGTAVIEKGSVK